jgi:hypothetical protein
MILTLTYTGKPATDLGYLPHKSPLRVHSFEQAFGKTHVFYPEPRPSDAPPHCYWKSTRAHLVTKANATFAILPCLTT